jgi:hypothetical protein
MWQDKSAERLHSGILSNGKPFMDRQTINVEVADVFLALCQTPIL